MDVIPNGKQGVTQRDIDAVIKVLQSDFPTQSPVVPKFGQAIANYCGARLDFVDIDPTMFTPIKN